MPEKKPTKRLQKKLSIPGQKERVTVNARTKEELAERIKQVQKKIDCGVNVTDKTFVGEWAKTWIDQYKQGKRPNTLVMYRNALNVHILPLIGSMRLKDVKPVNIMLVMNQARVAHIKRKCGVIEDRQSSESAQRKVLVTLQQLFQTAADNDLILKNPCKSLKVDKQQREEKIKTLSEEQQAEMLEKSKGTRAELFVALGLYCGLRREESLGLMWSDIDWVNKNLKIQRSVTFQGVTANLEPFTKSAASRRTIPIPEPLMDMLSVVNPNHEGTGTITIDTPKKNPKKAKHVNSIYACPALTGSIMTQSSYDRAWGVITRRVSFEVTSHMLRHTYCTTLHKAGVDLRMAQYLMGHADIKMTAKIYTHIENNQIETASAKISEIFGKSEEKLRTN